jgi:hypothetical protein
MMRISQDSKDTEHQIGTRSNGEVEGRPVAGGSVRPNRRPPANYAATPFEGTTTFASDSLSEAIGFLGVASRQPPLLCSPLPARPGLPLFRTTLPTYGGSHSLGAVDRQENSRPQPLATITLRLRCVTHCSSRGGIHRLPPQWKLFPYAAPTLPRFPLDRMMSWTRAPFFAAS